MNVPATIPMPADCVRVFQRKLYRAAKQSANRRFGILYDKVYRWEVVTEAWRRVARNGGSAGVDGQSIEWIEKQFGVERFLQELQQELQEERYDAAAIRRVYIPKGDGRQRPLGIPTVKDRVVQMAVKLVIEPLFEADFLDCSYGFRPQRSNQQAVGEVQRAVNTRKWVVDIDLANYFDTIPHGKLLDCVRKRVSDPQVLYLIRCWLKAGIMEAGCVRNPASGTPQGGVLSPLLSNIYLHELDQRMQVSAEGQLIRFADDLVVLCHKSQQAQRSLAKIKEIVNELGLALNEGKTRIGHIRDRFDFLGFTYREAYSRQWQRLVRVMYPRAKSLQAIRQRIKDAIKRVPLGAEFREVIQSANGKLRGWANYFRIGHSYGAAWDLQSYVCEQLRIWWRRRKQRKRIHGRCAWENDFFCRQGLVYVPALVRGGANAV